MVENLHHHQCNALQWPKHPKIAPSCGGSGPPSNTWFLRPTKWHVDRFSHFFRADIRLQQTRLRLDRAMHAMPAENTETV